MYSEDASFHLPFLSSGPLPPAGRGEGWGSDPDQTDPAFVHQTMDRVERLFGPRGYFRPTVEGWENLPPEPALIVCNHSGGTTVIDMFGLGNAWYRHHGHERPLHALGHDMIFRAPPVARRAARLGGLRAGPGVALQVLTERRRDLLVCPGGDRDAWRATRDRYRVHFSGRVGYAKLALRAGVPVVPIAHAGAHDGLYVLSDGAALARALRFPQLFRAEIMPVQASFPWGLTVGPWPHLPPPTALRYRIGRPIYPRAGPLAEPTSEQIQAHDRQIRAGLQVELDALAATERPLPERARAALQAAGRLGARAADRLRS